MQQSSWTKWIGKIQFLLVLSGCVQNGYAEAALKFFLRIQISKIMPSVATMIGLHYSMELVHYDRFVLAGWIELLRRL